MDKFLIDTSVLLDFALGDENTADFLETLIKTNKVPYISILTVFELSKKVDISKHEALGEFLNKINKLPISTEAAIRAGHLVSISEENNDVNALIAATAIENDYIIISLSPHLYKDFKVIAFGIPKMN